MVMLNYASELRSLTLTLYDTETRPIIAGKLVSKAIEAVGAETVVPQEAVDYVASLTTYSGLLEKGTELYDAARPYLEKANDSTGRKELIHDTLGFASEKILEPAKAKAKAKLDTKVVQPTKELAAPYIQKMATKKEALVSDNRVESALENLKYAKEHPKEVVESLKLKAINLIKYDDVASYREYVLSPQFQDDTKRMIQVELPAIACDAAGKGRAKLALAATTLSAELELKSAALRAAAKRGYEWGTTAEYREIQAAAAALVHSAIEHINVHTEQITNGVVEIKNGNLSLSDVISNVVKAFMPFGVQPEPTAEPTAEPTDEPTDEPADKPVAAAEIEAAAPDPTDEPPPLEATETVETAAATDEPTAEEPEGEEIKMA